MIDEMRAREKNIDTYIEALDRAKTLLKATWNLLQKQNKTIYVLNMLEELVYYDGCEQEFFAECHGVQTVQQEPIVLTLVVLKKYLLIGWQKERGARNELFSK